MYTMFALVAANDANISRTTCSHDPHRMAPCMRRAGGCRFDASRPKMNGMAAAVRKSAKPRSTTMLDSESSPEPHPKNATANKIPPRTTPNNCDAESWLRTEYPHPNHPPLQRRNERNTSQPCHRMCNLDLRTSGPSPSACIGGRKLQSISPWQILSIHMYPCATLGRLKLCTLKLGHTGAPNCQIANAASSNARFKPKRNRQA